MTLTPILTDHQLKHAIAEELQWTPDIDADQIGVSVTAGAVTLSGQVMTYPEKRAAVEATLRLGGVIAVADEIEVHNDWAPRQDADVAREVARVLSHTSYPSSPHSVKAEVDDHVVTLTGQVGWNYQRESLARAIAAVPGVHGLVNRIVLKPRLTISPEDARTKIALAFHRNAVLDAERIEVDVTGSTITLSGRVSSWAEHQQAARTAWAVPGVCDVVNKLQMSL